MTRPKGVGLKLRAEPPLLEKFWRGQVKTLATNTGWRYYYNPDSVGCAPGFPDLVLARHGRVILAELKTDSKASQPEPAQLEWLQAISGIPMKPDWTIEQFEQALLVHFDSLLWAHCGVILRPRYTEVLTRVLTSGVR